MPEYLELGDEWVNVDKVLRFRVTRNKPGEVVSITLFYPDGESYRVKGETAQHLMAYLEKHRAAE